MWKLAQCRVTILFLTSPCKQQWKVLIEPARALQTCRARRRVLIERANVSKLELTDKRCGRRSPPWPTPRITAPPGRPPRIQSCPLGAESRTAARPRACTENSAGSEKDVACRSNGNGGARKLGSARRFIAQRVRKREKRTTVNTGVLAE